MIKDFILASASPRRLELLKTLGLTPKKVIPAGINEERKEGETVLRYVKRMAQAKAAAVAKDPAAAGENILAADTIVARGKFIIGKTDSRETAKANLKMLSGRRHNVLTAVCMIAKDGRQSLKVSTTAVKFKRLTDAEIDAYLATDEWQNKAGSYAIQGKAAAFISYIGGSYSGVVGLPLFEVSNIFCGAGGSVESKTEGEPKTGAKAKAAKADKKQK
jgi:septum formation protein